MSDHGYECHGAMTAITLPSVSEEPCACLCVECGVYRDLFSPGDPRRAEVKAQMPAIIAAYLLVSRSDTA